MNPWESNYKSHQGNVGLGRAIAYYTEKGYTVMLPLNDTQKYDLVIDKDGLLQRVSVKTTQFIANKKNEFSVLLKKCGGSSGNAKCQSFNNKDCDILFVLTITGIMYEIPTKEINVKNALTLAEKWNKYIITFNLNGTSASEEIQKVEVG